MTELYPTTGTNYSKGLWTTRAIGSNPTSGSIDLRAEMHKFLYGDGEESGKGHYIAIRGMGTARRCVCMLEEDGERTASPDPKCSVCHGAGYLYTDRWAFAYRSLAIPAPGLPQVLLAALPGATQVDSYYYFLEYDTAITRYDRIIEVNLDLEGNRPDELGEENYDQFYRITELVKFRADNRGRVEYIMAVAKKEED